MAMAQAVQVRAASVEFLGPWYVGKSWENPLEKSMTRPDLANPLNFPMVKTYDDVSDKKKDTFFCE